MLAPGYFSQPFKNHPASYRVSFAGNAPAAVVSIKQKATLFDTLLLRMRERMALRYVELSTSKNGGGGENRTRVQRSREADIYKLSLMFLQSPCGPLTEAQTANRDRDYVLSGASNR